MNQDLTILYQNFYDCYVFCKDTDYFKPHFLNFSKGIFPKCIFYNIDKKEMRISKHNEIKFLKLTDNVEENFTSIRLILSDFLRMGDADENERSIIKKNKPRMDKIKIETSASDWKLVKTNDIKKLIINQYVKKLNIINIINTSELSNLIYDAVLKNEIKNDDIEIFNGEIINIKNLSYLEHENKYIITPSLSKKK